MGEEVGINYESKYKELECQFQEAKEKSKCLLQENNARFMDEIKALCEYRDKLIRENEILRAKLSMVELIFEK